MVVQGASTTSSWSMPIMFAPLRPSTPTILKETFWMRISLLIGDSPWNNSRLIVSPITQTLFALRTSCSPNISPSENVLPVADLEEGRGRTADLHRHPVAVPIDELRRVRGRSAPRGPRPGTDVRSRRRPGA